MTSANGNAAVYVQTNDATENEVVAFERRADGGLAPLGRFATGGRGTGEPHLPSQSSIVLGDDGQRLLGRECGQRRAVAVRGRERRAARCRSRRLRRRDANQRRRPRRSRLCAQQRQPSIVGFRLDGGKLVELEGSTRPLSADDADPAQVSFSLDGRTLVVTERGTDSISTYAIDERGYADGPSDDRVVREDAVRLRLHSGRRADRDRGVRRRRRRGGRVVVFAQRARQAGAGERLGGRHP